MLILPATDMQTITFIYGLYDPVSDDLRYIGKTICPTHRMDTHINYPHANLREWIDSLRFLGLVPVMKILDHCQGDGVDLECEWIRKNIAAGSKLLNKTWSQRIYVRKKSSQSVVCKPKTLTEPEEWWDAFQKQADKEGKTLSEWLGELGLQALPAKVRAKLPDRPPANRPKKE